MKYVKLETSDLCFDQENAAQSLKTEVRLCERKKTVFCGRRELDSSAVPFTAGISSEAVCAVHRSEDLRVSEVCGEDGNYVKEAKADKQRWKRRSGCRGWQGTFARGSGRSTR